MFLVFCSPLLILAQTRDNAGLRGDAGAVSGFFETYNPVNYPAGAADWWHMIDVRHSNNTNNFAMQFSGSFFDQNLYFRKTNNNPSNNWSRILLETAGKVGIGTSTPNSILEMRGQPIFDGSTVLRITNGASSYGRSNLVITGRFQDSNDGWNFGSAARNSIVFAQISGGSNQPSGEVSEEKCSMQLEGNSNSLGFMTRQNGSTPNMVMTQNGNIGIGTNYPDSRLSVNGNIRAKEIKVETSGWPDYVFNPGYELQSLLEVEKHIKEKGHLPGVPSAKQVEEKGLNIGEMNALLLKKIEELTLHVIDLKKENQLIHRKLKNLENAKK